MAMAGLNIPAFPGSVLVVNILQDLILYTHIRTPPFRRLADGSLLRTLEIGQGTGQAKGMAFSPDSSILAIALPDGTVRLWKVGP